MDEAVKNYRENLRIQAEEQQAKREAARKFKEQQASGKLIERLVVDKGGSVVFRPLNDFYTMPRISGHSVVKTSKKGNRLFRKVFCPEQFGLACHLCERRMDWNNLSASEQAESRLSKVLVMFGFDQDAVGKTHTYTNLKGEEVTTPVSPIKYFHRTAGKAESNWFELENYEIDCETGLDKMDLKISRIEGEEFTEYTVSYLHKTVGKEFRAPKGLSPDQDKLLKELMKAQKTGDMFYLFTKALQTFDLPEECTEYPNAANHELLVGMSDSSKSTVEEAEPTEVPY